MNTLAQETEDANYAGSTNVEAYVEAYSEDVPENGPKDEEQSQEVSGTNAKTGDESEVVFWIIMLMLSCIVLICEAKVKLQA